MGMCESLCGIKRELLRWGRDRVVMTARTKLLEELKLNWRNWHLSRNVLLVTPQASQGVGCPWGHTSSYKL